MQILNRETRIDFLGKRKIAFLISTVVIAVGIGSLVTQG